jgi:hypothetical protein
LIDDLIDYVFHAQTFGMVEQCYRFCKIWQNQAHTLKYVVVLTFPTKDQTIEMDMSSMLDRYQSLLSENEPGYAAGLGKRMAGNYSTTLISLGFYRFFSGR